MDTASTTTNGVDDHHDPAHDIDTKATVTWLAISTVFVFASVWLLFQLFHFVVFHEREEKIGAAPTTQLDQQRRIEQMMLGEGDQRLSIQDAIGRYVNR